MLEFLTGANVTFSVIPTSRECLLDGVNLYSTATEMCKTHIYL